jgi:hemin uptake protein HemP
MTEVPPTTSQRENRQSGGTALLKPAVGSATMASPVRRWTSAELLGDQLEVEIQHGVAVYRLRVTAQGKLILTK